MDYEKFQCFGQMPVTPDVLILPSELRYFIKVAAVLHENRFIYASLSSRFICFITCEFVKSEMLD